MSLKPLPGLLMGKAVAAPPAIYGGWYTGGTNGTFHQVTSTIINIRPPFLDTMQAIGVYGKNSGKWLAVHNGADWVGVAQGLPPVIAPGATNFGTLHYGCVLAISSSLNAHIQNDDFNESQTIALPGIPTPNYVAAASDLDDGVIYFGFGPTLDAIVWYFGNPITRTGGYSLFTGTTYYPCSSITGFRSEGTNVVTNWGAGPLPGFTQSWFPPGYNGWHS